MIPTLVSLSSALDAALRDALPAELTVYPPNMLPPGDPPAGGYVQIRFAGGKEHQASSGPAALYFEGSLGLTVEIYVPRGRGDGLALGLAEQILSVFSVLSIEGLSYFSGRVEEAGQEKDAPFYQVDVVTVFETDRASELGGAA